MRYLIAGAILVLWGVQAYGQVVFGQNRSNDSEGGLNVNYSSPKEFEIAGIEVAGVEFLDNNALISLSGLKVGDKIRFAVEVAETELSLRIEPEAVMPLPARAT